MEILRPFLQLGCSVRKACEYAGVPNSTVLTWVEADDDLRARVTAWQNEMNTLARRNWKEKLVDGDYQASKEWLQSKEKKEFSTRQEHDVDMNTPIRVVEVAQENDNQNQPDSPTIPGVQL